MKNYLFFLLILLAPCLLAQKPSIVSGVLRDAQSGETLIGATVQAPSLSIGNYSNEYGFYSLSLPVSEDSVELVFSYIGFETISRKVKPVGEIKLDIALSQIGTLIDEVVIKANALEDKMRSTEMSVTTLTSKEIKAVPVLFGESDILKILQLKPGFTPGSEGTTGLFVRGGNSDQNLIVLDEAVVYNPNHLFGFFSTFNSDAVKDLKVYKGGFPAQYGGRLSSVIDVRMKEGNNKKFTGSGGIGLIASRLTLEGPIQKDKSSFMISGRRTYVDLITREVNKANVDNPDYVKIPDYYFYDLNTKVNFTLSPKDRLYLSGYFGRDVFNFKDETFNFRFDWGNATGTARWNHQFGSKLFANTTFTFSDYRYKIQNILQGFSFSLSSNIKDANGKVDFYYQPNNEHTIRFGGNATYHNFITARLKAGSDDGQVKFEAGRDYDGAEFGAYFADEWSILPRVKLNYGLRFSAWNNSPAFYFNVEPRLAANYSVSEKWSIKGSYARMNQYVHLLASSGLSLPTDIWYPSTEGIKPEVSDQIAIGTSYLLGDQILITWEAWYKWLQNQVDFIDGAELFGNNELENELTIGRGKAYSPLELEIEKKEGKLTGWIGYTLAWVKRGEFKDINGGKYFPPRYDTRHNFTVVGTYELSKKWQFTATWVYSSGYVSWLPIGRYSLQDVPGAPFQTIVPVYGERNSFRYPPYMRGDLGIVYKWKKRWSEHDITVSVYNVTDRRNPYFIYIDGKYEETDLGEVPVGVQAKQVSLFPILPSVTWNFKF
ncbi:MAG: TonB-dependent receptor [Lewinellaceae bacterium]|nr:TonB-dependent receptor [Saprospiraceae bacterium]MCB9343831.1 TonB-dependent receptor [Lewinellaceae bacterium]